MVLNKKRVFKTILVVGLAEVFNKLAPLILVNIGSKRLGLEVFGQVTFGVGLLEVAAFMVSFGYHHYSMLKIGGDKDLDERSIGRHAGALLIMRAAHAVFASVLVLWMASGQSEIVRQISYLAVIALCLSALNMNFYFTIEQKIGQLTVVTTSVRCVLTASAFIFVSTPAEALLFAVVLYGTHCLTDIYSFFIFAIRYKIRRPNLAVMRNIWSKSFPFGIYFVLTVLLLRSDFFLAEVVSSPENLGLYSGISRVHTSLVNVGLLLATVFFAESFQTKNAKVGDNQLVKGNCWLLMQTFGMITILFYYFGSPILGILIGASFKIVTPVFQLMAASLIFMAGQIVATNLYFLRKQQIWSLNIALALEILIIFAVGYFLTPRFELFGIAYAIILSRICFSVFIYFACREEQLGSIITNETLKSCTCVLLTFAVGYVSPWDGPIVGFFFSSLTFLLLNVICNYTTIKRVLEKLFDRGLKI